MPILVVIAILTILYFGAKLLIPVLEVLLHLFVLLGAFAPFLLFIGIGIVIGLFLFSNDKCDL